MFRTTRKWSAVVRSEIRTLAQNVRRVQGLFWKKMPGMVSLMLGFTLLSGILPIAEACVWGSLISSLEGKEVPGWIARLAELLSFTSDPVQLMWMILALYGALLLGSDLNSRFQSLCQNNLMTCVKQQIDLLMLREKASLSLGALEDPTNLSIFQRVSNSGGTFKLTRFFELQFSVAGALIALLVSGGTLLALSPWLALPVLLTALPDALVQGWYGYAFWAMINRRNQKSRYAMAYSSALENPEVLSVLKMTGGVEYFFKKLKLLREEFTREDLKLGATRVFIQVGASVISQITMLGVYILLTREVLSQRISIGYFIFLLTLMGKTRGSVSLCFSMLGDMLQHSLVVSDIYLQLSLTQNIPPKAPSLRINATHTPRITFENVTARYPGSERDALCGVNLTINPGERLAIVGENGAGKSSLIRFLLGIYSPQDGRILIDDVDLQTIELQSWYDTLAYHPQQIFTYPATIEECIALGRAEVPFDRQRVVESARLAQALPFIEKLPNGFATPIGRFLDGVNFSGGEYQRLALARTFYRWGSVLILDEPTSAVDASAEEELFESLLDTLRSETLILVSHRFSTVRRLANRIIVVDGGEIIEDGSHEELMEKQGRYFEMYSLQQQAYV